MIRQIITVVADMNGYVLTAVVLLIVVIASAIYYTIYPDAEDADN